MAKKKNKKRFKKILKERSTQNHEIREQEGAQEISKTNQNKPPEKKSDYTERDEAQKKLESQTSKEIRKILLTVLVLITAIVAVYFANIKTDFILQSGEWLSKTLNISV